jgi:hypothetical protein
MDAARKEDGYPSRLSPGAAGKERTRLSLSFFPSDHLVEKAIRRDRYPKGRQQCFKGVHIKTNLVFLASIFALAVSTSAHSQQLFDKITMTLIAVSNIDKSKEFYTEKLGFKATTDYSQSGQLGDHFPRAQELVLGRASDAKARRSVAVRLRLR